jgi:MFS family permease
VHRAWRFLRESRTTRPSGGHAAATRTGREAIAYVLARWHEPAPRLIWIYAVAIGAFYGTIQTVPLLLQQRFSITERNVGYFVMYLGGMGVVVRALILGRVVERLGEARLSRLGILLLAGGLIATGVAGSAPLLFLGFTLMPLGTAFLFPCVTSLLSRVISAAERGLYMGVQHTFGGVSRVAFPIAAGVMMDRLGVGVPFWIAGVLVLACLPLTGALGGYLAPPSAPEQRASIEVSELTGEFPIDPAQTGPGKVGP